LLLYQSFASVNYITSPHKNSRPLLRAALVAHK